MRLHLILLLALAGSLAVRGESVRVHPNLFEGGWACDVQFMDVMGSPYLLAHGLGRRVKDSTARVTIPAAGTWRIWVRTRTWVEAKGAFANPSAFRVALGGRVVPKTFGLGGRAWHWEDGGAVELPAGETVVSLKDFSGFDARCAGVFLSNSGEIPEGALSVVAAPVAEEVSADLVVVGGGVPGTCAAVAAARSGLRVALVQDRPVLGGNASSEIRVWCAGEIANDIVREVRGRFMNMEQEASLGDAWRQRIVDDETNIVCRLRHRAFAVEKTGAGISAVKALDVVNNRVVRFRAPLFVDATGDGWVGYWAGADYRMGQEAAAEFDETMAPAKADGDTLGASLMWTSARAGTDEPFSAPWAEPWAKGEAAINGEWNWEYGIHQDVIEGGEEVRDRLLLAIYGAFSNAKRRPENCRRVLNFVPYLLGKRESRRLLGDWILSEKDVTGRRPFEDAVSRGSWSVDLHYDTCKPGVDFLTVCRQPHFGRYYIPFRSLYSRNVPNLMMAGRCFSCTHVGLGGPRVINTLALMGVACGYAAAECKAHSIVPRQVYERGLVRDIQRKLGGDWPGNPDPQKAEWRIVDNEMPGVVFGRGWTNEFCSSGCTVNDRYAVAASNEAEDAVFPLPVAKAGRYRLMRNLPYLAWEPVDGDTVAEIETDGRTETIRFPALEHVGGWSAIGTFDLKPGSRLHLMPSRSRGAVYADAFAVVPDEAPIFGPLSRLAAYERLNPYIGKAIAFLSRPDLCSLPNGRYEIDGSNCWANVVDVGPRTSGPVRYEAHRDMVDIHVPLTADEVFGSARTSEHLMSKLVDSREDCVLFETSGVERVIRPREFAIVFPPYGAHAPGLSYGSGGAGRKVVVKCRDCRVAVSRTAIFGGYDGKWCKVSPSVASDGGKMALMTYGMLNVSGSDVFSGQYVSKSTDGGRTWGKPEKISASADVYERGLRVARNVGVYYSAVNRKWYAMGAATMYENDKGPFQRYVDGKPYCYPVQADVDIGAGTVTNYRPLPFPLKYELAIRYGQVVECENGEVLMPFYFRPVGAGKRSQSIVVRYRFGKDGWEVVRVGKPVEDPALARGLGEPSLVGFRGKYYLTLRSDEYGMFAESDDGLNFSKPVKWVWADGKPIGNANTQQHWVPVGDRLYLAYTRVTPTNGHVFRNRAPIFIAEFDPVKRCLRRETEQAVVPERGARLGNFTVASGCGEETWLITAEWMQPKGCEKYGSDNSLWLVKMSMGYAGTRQATAVDR